MDGLEAEAPEPALTIGTTSPGAGLSVVGLFAGIGGIERGLHLAGHRTELLCEVEPAAQRVLRHHFPDVPLVGDVRDLRALPPADVLAAGFPCQDLSQAGKTVGIEGASSGLVGEVFRLLAGPRRTQPRWLLIENVPFMLHLARGRAMRLVTDSLEELGFTWAYRIVDARAFGLPQRRKRVILLASRTDDPRDVLFADDHEELPAPERWSNRACGFYWTEGVRGLGWAVDAVPTLKGGSTVGIPSPPAILLPDGAVVTPDVRDAERLQGFAADWTLPAVEDTRRKRSPRWKLVGNAVSVPVAEWVGQRLLAPREYVPGRDSILGGDRPLADGAPWPKSAWGRKGQAYAVELGSWPVRRRYHHLLDFLNYETTPLSARAAAGFLARTRMGTLHFPEGFIAKVENHLELMRAAAAA